MAHHQKLRMTFMEYFEDLSKQNRSLSKLFELLSKQNLILSKLFGLLSKNKLFLSKKSTTRYGEEP